MGTFDSISLAMTRLYVFFTLPPPRRDERGDVPGWVLVTLMTAGLVGIIWGIAKNRLGTLLRNALQNVIN